ncbi:transcription factor IIIB 50 kDa subunit [Dunckerocampus dactyliophorus]|uniref:transcription factor IIIB 50 kDa subunit n=1 Tax=Dunckerocampus dactyliophorus TaxID=161453 RepID=UPI002404B296|nr:transcription factor IIIB 50 kDa subunit [Dunckerocampus dactyliophorus]
MSTVGLKCPGCGSSNIVEDDLHTQRQLICVDCGAVVSEGALTHDTFEGTDVSYSRTTAVTKKPCLNQIKGQQRVKALCRALRVNAEIETLSSTYFAQAYEHESFIKVSLQKKENLAGCCVLASCRQLNWPVTMGTISCLLEADTVMMGAVFQNMIKILKIEAPLVNVTDVMEAHCQEYKITSLDVHEDLAEDHKDLNKRALALVELAAESWIVTGRKPVPLMMAMVYLAWQSLNPNHVRLKMTLEKFCLIAKMRKHRAAMTRVAEIKRVLCKLGKEIPWVTDAVTSENVVKHVEDIVKNRYALLRRALKTHELALQEESEEPSETEGQTTCEKAKQTNGHNNNDEADQHPQPNWGKRVLLAPPCVTHPKKRRVHPEGLKDVTGDEDISDSEIESYIRTPREAREFALAQAAFVAQTETTK